MHSCILVGYILYEIMLGQMSAPHAVPELLLFFFSIKYMPFLNVCARMYVCAICMYAVADAGIRATAATLAADAAIDAM